MNIANKIILLIVFLLCVLSVNTWVGLRQMVHIRAQFAAMAGHGAVLTEAVEAIHQLQLQKGILLQRLIGIAEEMGFEQVGFARAEYLRDQLKNIREGLGRYAQAGAQETWRARRAASMAAQTAGDEDQRLRLRQILEDLNRLETARRGYNALLEGMLHSIESGGFQLSLEDLENCQRRENDLAKGIEGFLKRVQNFSRDSLVKAGQWEDRAQRVLALILGMTAMLGCLLAWWIVLSIVRPLRALSSAAGQVGRGNFDVRLDASSKDEFAQLASAFNVMIRQLAGLKAQLEQQNADLKTANVELDRFIHIMGQDIANPLTVMIGYCAYLEQHHGAAMDAKSMEALQGIRRSSTRMHQMVKELLEFTKSKRIKDAAGILGT